MNILYVFVRVAIFGFALYKHAQTAYIWGSFESRLSAESDASEEQMSSCKRSVGVYKKLSYLWAVVAFMNFASIFFLF